MSLLQQLIQFLSQPPDSLVYHVIVLLALQVVFWLALSQARRNPSDDLAKRLAWVSGGIMLGRLILLIASIAVSNTNEAVSILPPLERAIDASAAALLVWGLAPRYKRAPKLGDAVLIIVLIAIGFIYLFFAKEWLDTLSKGAVVGGYQAMPQATAWDLIQMAILGTGIVLVSISREVAWPLRVAILAILFIAQGISLVVPDYSTISGTQVDYWNRLGNLIAYPLLAIFTYRYHLTQIMTRGNLPRSRAEQIAYILNLSRETIESPKLADAIQRSLDMSAQIFDSDFIAIGLPVSGDPLTLAMEGRLKTNTHQELDENSLKHWTLSINDWPALRSALNDRRQVELKATESGARQYHEFLQQLSLDLRGPLLFTPLIVQEVSIGLTLHVGSRSWQRWPDQERALASSVAEYIAAAIYGAQQRLGGVDETPAQGASQIERERAASQIASLTGRVTALENQLATETARANTLETALAATKEDAKIRKIIELEEETAALRESLVQAEEALAQAAASDAGLSTEWVMRAVTRYSGELEETQARIQELEQQLKNKESGRDYSRVAARIRQLRTPLTSLSVYTDLLISESLGALSSQQMSLVGRIRSNISNMVVTIDQLSALARQAQAHELSDQFVDIRDTIEAAINAVGSTIRSKRLTLDMDLEKNLPVIPSNNGSIYEIVTHLLAGACQISLDEGRLRILARHEKGTGPQVVARSSSFLHIAIAGDSVPYSASIHAYLASGGELAPELASNDRLKPAVESLSVAFQLANVYGGRTWIDHDGSGGSTVSVLLPTTLDVSSGSDETNGR